MAEYKLIQDVEAEDKILGPLTLRQFIFALITAFLSYLCVFVVSKHLPFLLAVFLPPALFCGFFAFPFGRDQPTEVWALAKLRFWFKPRRRVWNQSGVKELVTITVPKKVERVLTNGLSQTEVKSRLRALADTIDSRGWAVKNATSGTYAQPLTDTGSDRLIDIGSLPKEVPGEQVPVADDILDENNNPIAQQFETMIDQSSRNHRQQLMDQLNNIRQNEVVRPTTGGASTGKWFINVKHGRGTAGSVIDPPATSTVMSAAAPVVSGAPGLPAATASPADEAVLAASLSAQSNSRQVSFGNLRTVQPLASSGAAATGTPAASLPEPVSAVPEPPAPVVVAQNSSVTATSDPDILSLAKNDDLNVATLAREAHKKKSGQKRSRDEVVISLH